MKVGGGGGLGIEYAFLTEGAGDAPGKQSVGG